jgi:hypothetical protein
MPPFEVQITVAGRVGAVLESVFADLDTEVAPRHHVVHVGSSSMDDVVRLLRTLEQRDVEFDRVSAAARTGRG